VINSAYKSLKDDEVRLEYDKRNREPVRMSSSSAGGFGKKKDPSPVAVSAPSNEEGVASAVEQDRRKVSEKGKKGKKSSKSVKEDTVI